MVTWCGPFSKIFIAMEVACFSHRYIYEDSINPGQCAYCAMGCAVSLCKNRAERFREREEKMKEGSLSCITVGECLSPNIEPSFLRLANIEVSHNHSSKLRVQWSMRRDKPESFAQTPQGQVWREVNIDNHKITVTSLHLHNVITSLARNHMCNNRSFKKEISLRIQMADPPAFTLFGMKVPYSQNRGTTT